MSSFDTLESSVQDSRPIELYQITQGSTVYRYASCASDTTVGSVTYSALAIARSRVEQGSDAENRTITITVPGNEPFAQQYIDVVPGERATVRIYRYQRDESPAFDTQVLLFDGIVQSVRFQRDGHSAEINVRSAEAAMNRNIPRFTYMGMCNHFLYDESCGVSPGSFNHIGEVSAVSGNTITVTGADASGFDFVGGYCRPPATEDYRLVLAQSGDDLTLLLPFFESPVGSNVQLFAGCDHLVDGDCASTFDNVINFGGFPFVPNRNPFQTGL